MNLNIVDVIVAIAGGVLIYAAVKNKNPVTVVSDALNGKNAPVANPTATPTATDTPTPVTPGTTPGQVVATV